MHLVYKALEKEPVPMTLPPDLVPPGKRKKTLAGAVPVLPPPGAVPGPIMVTPVKAGRDSPGLGLMGGTPASPGLGSPLPAMVRM